MKGVFVIAISLCAVLVFSLFFFEDREVEQYPESARQYQHFAVESHPDKPGFAVYTIGYDRMSVVLPDLYHVPDYIVSDGSDGNMITEFVAGKAGGYLEIKSLPYPPELLQEPVTQDQFVDGMLERYVDMQQNGSGSPDDSIVWERFEKKRVGENVYAFSSTDGSVVDKSGRYPGARLYEYITTRAGGAYFIVFMTSDTSPQSVAEMDRIVSTIRFPGE